MARSPVGSLLPISGTDSRSGQSYSHAAFIPDPLGEPPELSAAAWKSVVSASAALARLDQRARVAGARELAAWMSAPLLRLEAQSTSAIEGTFEPARAVLEADENDTSSQSAEMREILNYVRAARRCFHYATEGRELTLGTLCELQRELVINTPGETRDSGQLRRGQVAIGSRTGSIEAARFVPMPPGIALESALTSLLDWDRDRASRGSVDLVEIAMFHYQFESIHPFSDGNGRIGRMLIVHSLLTRGILAEPLLTVSPWLERNDDEYRERLFGVSATGDWSAWIEFFARAIERSSTQVTAKMNRVDELVQEMIAAVSDARAGSVQRRLPEILIRRPVLSISDITRELECTAPPAQKAVDKLVELGFMTEVTGSNYGRRYAADGVLDALVSQGDLH